MARVDGADYPEKRLGKSADTTKPDTVETYREMDVTYASQIAKGSKPLHLPQFLFSVPGRQTHSQRAYPDTREQRC